MYLDRQTIERTLRSLATLPKGSTVVFDYVLPKELCDDRGVHYAKVLGTQAAQGGEPWQCVLTPKEAADFVAVAGWEIMRDIPESVAAGETFWPRTDGLQPIKLIHFIEARLSI